MEVRRKSIVVLLGITIAGLVGASAASLGGITNESLGADAVVVASCDTDGIIAEYTTGYSTTLQAYEVTGVDLTDVAAGCAGKAWDVTLELLDKSVTPNVSTQISDNGVVQLGGGSFSASFTGVAAEDIVNLAVVISG